MPTPEQERQMLEALKRMGDKLIELGYAQRIMFEDNPQSLTILWNPSGLIMKKELGRIFDSVAKGGEINVLEIKALLALFLRTDDADEIGNQGR